MNEIPNFEIETIKDRIQAIESGKYNPSTEIEINNPFLLYTVKNGQQMFYQTRNGKSGFYRDTLADDRSPAFLFSEVNAEKTKLEFPVFEIQKQHINEF